MSEIQSGTPILTPAEQTVATLAAWHPLIDVWVDPSGEKNAVGSVWRVYSIVGAVRALIGAGVVQQSQTPVKVVDKLRGSGNTIELAVISPQGPTVGAVKASIVGYSETDSAAEGAGAGALLLSQVDQDVATLAWFPRVDVTVKGNGDEKARGSIWDLFAVLPGFNCLAASGVLIDPAIQQTVIRGIIGGASSWLLRARSTLGNTAALVTGGITGTGTGGAQGLAGGVLAGSYPNPTLAAVVPWGNVSSGAQAGPVHTADATVTLLGSMSIADNKATTLDFLVKGKDRVTGASFSKQFHQDFSRIGGAAPVAATNPDIAANNVLAPAWPGVTFTFGASAAGVPTLYNVFVQGAVATDIDWVLIPQTMTVP